MRRRPTAPTRPGPRAQVTHNAIRFEFVDGTGGDSLERPPNGHPTAAALDACTLLIPAWIGELMRGERPFGYPTETPPRKLQVFKVTLGQGLVDQVRGSA